MTVQHMIPSPDGMRLPPVLPAEAVKTYRIVAPLRTHWRPATCEEVACEHYLCGWQTILDESTEQGQYLASIIRNDLRRTHIWAEDREPTGLTCFTFPPGQSCVRASTHRIRVEREELFLVTGGDWRGNPRGENRVHKNMDHWLEDFGEHQDRLADRLEQG